MHIYTYIYIYMYVYVGIYMIEKKSEVVIPQKPFIEVMVMTSTIEERFLDISLHLNNCIYEFKVYRESAKQPTHWSSKIPKRYKRNMTLRNLHRLNCISLNGNEEIKFISQKY